MNGNLGVELPQSIGMLVEILTSIDAILAWIVRESRLIRSEFQPLFQELWENTHTRIQDAIRDLESVDSEDHPLYRSLEDYGLTGDSLKLKAAIGRHLGGEVIDSAAITEQPRESAPRILGISLKPLLKWINLILGQSSQGIPTIRRS